MNTLTNLLEDISKYFNEGDKITEISKKSRESAIEYIKTLSKDVIIGIHYIFPLLGYQHDENFINCLHPDVRVEFCILLAKYLREYKGGFFNDEADNIDKYINHINRDNNIDKYINHINRDNNNIH